MAIKYLNRYDIRLFAHDSAEKMLDIVLLHGAGENGLRCKLISFEI